MSQARDSSGQRLVWLLFGLAAMVALVVAFLPEANDSGAEGIEEAGEGDGDPARPSLRGGVQEGEVPEGPNQPLESGDDLNPGKPQTELHLRVTGRDFLKRDLFIMSSQLQAGESVVAAREHRLPEDKDHLIINGLIPRAFYELRVKGVLGAGVKLRVRDGYNSAQLVLGPLVARAVKVLDADTGRPVPGCSISPIGEESQVVSTDADGLARLASSCMLGEPVGVLVQADGYASARHLLAAYRELSTISIGKGVSLRGRILDVEGQPQAGASVTAVLRPVRGSPSLILSSRELRQTRSTTTDSEGWFELPALPPGRRVCLTAHHPGKGVCRAELTLESPPGDDFELQLESPGLCNFCFTMSGKPGLPEGSEVAVLETKTKPAACAPPPSDLLVPNPEGVYTLDERYAGPCLFHLRINGKLHGAAGILEAGRTSEIVVEPVGEPAVRGEIVRIRVQDTQEQPVAFANILIAPTDQRSAAYELRRKGKGLFEGRVSRADRVIVRADSDHSGAFRTQEIRGEILLSREGVQVVELSRIDQPVIQLVGPEGIGIRHALVSIYSGETHVRNIWTNASGAFELPVSSSFPIRLRFSGIARAFSARQGVSLLAMQASLELAQPPQEGVRLLAESVASSRSVALRFEWGNDVPRGARLILFLSGPPGLGPIHAQTVSGPGVVTLDDLPALPFQITLNGLQCRVDGDPRLDFVPGNQTLKVRVVAD